MYIYIYNMYVCAPTYRGARSLYCTQVPCTHFCIHIYYSCTLYSSVLICTHLCCTHLCIHIYMSTYISMYTHIYVYIYINIYIHIYASAHLSCSKTRMYKSMSSLKFVHMYVYFHICQCPV